MTGPKRFTVAMALLAAPLALSACEWLSGVNMPDELHVVIESTDVSEAILITSAHFLLIDNPECPDNPDGCERVVQLVTADTTRVTLPYNEILPFTERQQYFVETWSDRGLPTTLSMQIEIDGEEWYNDFRQLLPEDSEGEQETLRFVYNFRELVL